MPKSITNAVVLGFLFCCANVQALLNPVPLATETWNGDGVPTIIYDPTGAWDVDFDGVVLTILELTTTGDDFFVGGRPADFTGFADDWSPVGIFRLDTAGYDEILGGGAVAGLSADAVSNLLVASGSRPGGVSLEPVDLFVVGETPTVIPWRGADGTGGSGTFQEDSHWAASTPGVGEIAGFIENAAPVVTFVGDAQSDELRISSGRVTLASDSATRRTYTLATGAAKVDVEGGSLQIGLAGMPVHLAVGDRLSIGNVEKGALTVAGNDSRVTATSELIIGNGTLDLQDGGNIDSTTASIGIAFDSIGTASVNGASSVWMSDNLYVGGNLSAPSGTGTLDITNDGLVEIANETRIWNRGGISLNGGQLVTNTFLNTDGGEFNLRTGTLTVQSGIGVGNGTPYVHNARLHAGQHLVTPGTTQVAASRTLTLDGGQLTTATLDVQGTLLFNSGVLELTGTTISGLDQLTVPTNGQFRGSGTHRFAVTGAVGSTITATADLTLGDATRVNGFGTAGSLEIGPHTVILQDANDVVFDSLAVLELGDERGPGTLRASNGLTLDFGGNLVGSGTVDTPNDRAKPLVNNGHIMGMSLTNPIELAGHVKGVGTCDNCNITGTEAPGFSAAAVNRGSVSYNGTLEIEIGGTSAGTEFDQLNHLLGAGVADLGGTLAVQLLPHFTPSSGDTFEIITAASVVDRFDEESLPALDGLTWDIAYGADNVVLSVLALGTPTALLAGDADQDLDFDQFDLIKVQIAAKYLSGQPATWGEGDWNGAPGGGVGNPPIGDRVFNQFDIIAAQQAGVYLSGPYAALNPNEQEGDGQTSVIYDAVSGEVRVDLPAGVELTSINIDSASDIFTADPAQNLGGSFDNDADGNIFKATFGGSFGSISFGNVARFGLAHDFLLGDLTIVGSRQGGGGLGDVHLIYIPEPSALLLLVMAFLTLTLQKFGERGTQVPPVSRYQGSR